MDSHMKRYIDTRTSVGDMPRVTKPKVTAI